MSGDILVKSKHGHGSTFQVLFPLRHFDQEKVVNENNLKSKKEIKKILPTSKLPEILVVDDDETTRDIVRLFLKNTYKVDFAKSGDIALNLVKKKRYQIILMDINLGKGLSGIETTGQIKNLKQYKNIPIVALTAFAMAGEKEEFLKSGLTHYLSKPFMKKDLVSLLKEILD
jgi:CheY-like chemotaxis protein